MPFMLKSKLYLGATLAAVMSIAAVAEDASFDRNAALETVETLAADNMGGRAAGTDGNAMARAYLLERITDAGFEPVGPSFEHQFKFTPRLPTGAPEITGTNLLFRIAGAGNTGKTIVVSAHYDHVGTRGGQIFNGADDNASGVAGALAIAEALKNNPPENDFIFALFDAEEMGLQGARAFVRNRQMIDPNIAFNINFDMLSRSDKNELYVAGVFHRPELKPVVESVASKVPVTLLMGHDDPALGNNDWTFASDHGPFHSDGVPFLYFGVEDHPHYHRPSDVYDSIPVDFFLRSLETVVMAAREVDRHLAAN
ncbi:MAG: M28 family peptidase [Kordiimonadaceae bacterium]|nr:M28 family peptidase [Kordiimonadaceae bacterium]MBO6569049.1 M28 family peptidase [Kordiimonadaceae bacterium]MBO6964524.1 M28 family peptidase [Kordiimonadaceae bacterium]